MPRRAIKRRCCPASIWAATAATWPPGRAARPGRRPAAETDIPRLRLSSLEPWDIAPGFFELWANPRLMPHLHLPLQSGSDTVLRRMARRTSQTAFRALVSEARAAIPDLHISTDLIAGFPGESETEFAEMPTSSCSLANRHSRSFPSKRSKCTENRR